MIWIYAERIVALVKCLEIANISIHALTGDAMRVYVFSLNLELRIPTISSPKPKPAPAVRLRNALIYNPLHRG